MSINSTRPEEAGLDHLAGPGRRVDFAAKVAARPGQTPTPSQVRRAWQVNIDFIGRMRGILWLSGLLTVLSLVTIWRLGLELGTDFAGGYEMEVHFPRAVEEAEIRALLAPLKLDDARVQRFGQEGSNEFLIMVRNAKAALDVGKQHEVRRALEQLVTERTALTELTFAESGERLQVGFAAPVAKAQLEEALRRLDIAVVNVSGGERSDRPEYIVQVASLADDITRSLLDGLKLPASTQLMQRIEFVGPQVGEDLRNEGILAVVWSLGLILLYVAFRFDMFFAPGAIIATLHDLILTMALFAVLRLEFNLTVVAAVLTLIGFSLNDTIVVFDRIRENVSSKPAGNLRAIVNRSINETLSRTVLTSGTVLLVSLSLLLLGGHSLRGFSAVMLIGVVIGTYSSIFVAAPVYIALRDLAGTRPAKR